MRNACRLVFFAMAAASFLCVGGLRGDGTDAAPAPEKPPVATSYVFAQWHPAGDFQRISEYFTGRENTGGDIVVRTDNSNRAGLYFHVGLPLGTRFPEGSQAVLEYVDGAHPEAFKRTFALPAMPTGPFAEIRLGLTGKDWPQRSVPVVAWRITITDNTGAVVVRSQSFLWSIRETPDVKK
ncbi:MAG: hypothetical protein LBV28_03495 [Puniceicoccales bacterium]|jgi:hypothetical protein|nr:hypothetical protein [Puniceicoccales bacterium]